MRYKMLLAALCLSSVSVFADDLAPVPVVPVGLAEVFTCSFHGGHDKDEVRCVVSALACLPIAPAVSAETAVPQPSPTESPDWRFCRDSELVVECTNGFSLHDHGARTVFRRGDVTVKGRDDGHEAAIKIRGVFGDPMTTMDRRSSRFKAELELENDVNVDLRGKCTQVGRRIVPTEM